MSVFDLPTDIVDRRAHANAVGALSEAGVVLPTFAELADPATMAPAIRSLLATVDPDAPRPANLFRVHWYNDAARTGVRPVPGYRLLPPALTGVAARIAVVLGCRFPMIGAHKVLAAYGCLAPRIVSGGFDPTRQRAVWPSTGNYCRGGVAISRIIGCRGVAVLPEGMSRERFQWLERWVADAADIIRTPGTESNVKEIYDACAALARDPANAILNQFAEFGNYLVHFACTGRALADVFEDMTAAEPGLSLAAFVAATGSAGTLAAGDYLKETAGARIAVVEPVECPTLLYNGYGAHNIQGIGDKHVPLIHNVMNTDVVIGVSDRATDALDLLFNSTEGRRYLVERQGIDADWLATLDGFGLSSIANIAGAIKLAKRLDLGENDVVLTIATDGAPLYASERARTRAGRYPGGFDAVNAGEIFGQHLAGLADDHVLELGHRDRQRILNLGYYTWVEQQGIALADFDRRRDQGFWRSLRKAIPAWDEMIREFNHETGVNAPS